MFSKVAIASYKVLDNLVLPHLRRVNLISGDNNAGKTTLLEALFLLLGDGNPALTLKLNTFRGLTKVQGEPREAADWVWKHLFSRADVRQEARIEGQWGGNGKRALAISTRPMRDVSVDIEHGGEARGTELVFRFTAKGKKTERALRIGGTEFAKVVGDGGSAEIPGFFLPSRWEATHEEDAVCYGKLQVAGAEYDLLRALRTVEPRLKAVASVAGPGGTLLYGDVGSSGMMPLARMGGGLARLSSILLRIASAQRGVVLIDEIENGFYHGRLDTVWEAIVEAAVIFDAQLFATSHSLECIRAAYQASKGRKQPVLQFHRLERTNGSIHCVSYEDDELLTALKRELEVR